MRGRYIEQFRWPPGIEDKVFVKHGLLREEVEECFFHPEFRRRKSRGSRILLSRTDSGRYLLVVYSLEESVATIITAREMTDSERRQFRRK